MVKKENLEKVMKEKVEPIIDEAMQKYLGVKIDKINEDISDRIEESPLIEIDVNVQLPFKIAKKMFKKDFLVKVIQTNYANISKVADILQVNRRSLHRLIKDFDIDVDSLREQMLRPTYYKQEMVDTVLRKVLDSYKTVLHPEKLATVYKNVEKLSENIAQELKGQELTLKQAEEIFEKEYLKKALLLHRGNLTQMAKIIKIRYETLLRKLKKLDLK